MKMRNAGILKALAALSAVAFSTSAFALGDTLVLSGLDRISSFNRSAPGTLLSSVRVTGLTARTLLGFDYRPQTGELWALDITGRLYTVDPVSGAAQFRSTLSVPLAQARRYGVSFNPVADRLRIVTDTGQNLRVNVDTGAVIVDGTINPAPSALAAASYTSSFANACRTTLYTIDPTNDALNRQDPPNNGTQFYIGSLPVSLKGDVGFDIEGATNTAIVAVNSGANGPSLYTLNLATGDATLVGPVGVAVPGEQIVALTSAPPPTPIQPPGELIALTENGAIATFMSGSPQRLCTGPTTVTNLAGGAQLVGMDVRPATNQLIGVATPGSLYTIDRITGVATFLSSLSTPLSGASFGVDFNPVPDRLRVVSNTGQNLRINVDTGAVTVDGSINGVSTGVTAAAYTNSFGALGTLPAAGGTTLYTIDTSTGQLNVQNPPNNGTQVTVGSLGVTATAINGFDINGRNGAAFAALEAGGARVSALYSINLGTGAATLINPIGAGQRIAGLSYTFAPNQPTVYAATADGRLISFAPNNPGVILSNVPITGVKTSRRLLGMDFRPATGQLVALSGSQLISINPLTGLATQVSRPGADPSDVTPPTFDPAVLNTTANWDVDFNPLVDRLRAVSDADDNLRINVRTGAVIGDGTLNPSGDVTAAAYTNNFTGGTTTALYVIDPTSDQLLLQNPPNNGTLTVVGPLGVDLQGNVCFDIVGGNNGLALVVGTSGATRLYRIDLATGALTAVGLIGDGTPVIQAMAVSLP